MTDGWPDVEDRHELKLFTEMSHELSFECGCLLQSNRVIVPASLREKVVNLLHDGHPGVVKMKSIARQYVWWPGIDKTLERHVQSCTSCQENR